MEHHKSFYFYAIIFPTKYIKWVGFVVVFNDHKQLDILLKRDVSVSVSVSVSTLLAIFFTESNSKLAD